MTRYNYPGQARLYYTRSERLERHAEAMRRANATYIHMREAARKGWEKRRSTA